MLDFWLLFDAGSIILETIVLIIFANVFLQRKSKYSLLIFTLHPILIAIVDRISFLRSDVSDFNILLIYIFIDLFVIHIAFRNKFSQKIFLITLFYMVAFLADMTTLASFEAFGYSQKQILLKNDTFHIVATIISRLIIIGLLFFASRWKSAGHIFIDNEQWIRLLAIPLITCFLTLNLYFFDDSLNFDQEMDLILIGSVILLMLSFNYMTMRNLQGMEKEAEARYHSKIEAEQRKLQQKYFNLLQSSQEQVKRVVHDFRHHLSFLDAALEAEELQKARDYLQALHENLTEQLPIKTGNLSIDTILMGKGGLMANNQVTLKCQGLLPEKLPFTDLDLSILLGNALDNAMEACLNITDPTIAKEVKTSFSYVNESLFMEFSNPVATKFLGPNFLQTKKNNPEAHGLGLGIMQSVVDRYAGHLEIHTVDGIFRLSILLQNYPESQNYPLINEGKTKQAETTSPLLKT